MLCSDPFSAFHSPLAYNLECFVKNRISALHRMDSIRVRRPFRNHPQTQVTSTYHHLWIRKLSLQKVSSQDYSLDFMISRVKDALQ